MTHLELEEAPARVPAVFGADLSAAPAFFGVPGHCFDADGNWWHDPGTCKGAPNNCTGRCCGQDAPAALSSRAQELEAEARTATAEAIRTVGEDLAPRLEVLGDQIGSFEAFQRAILETLYRDDLEALGVLRPVLQALEVLDRQTIGRSWIRQELPNLETVLEGVSALVAKLQVRTTGTAIAATEAALRARPATAEDCRK